MVAMMSCINYYLFERIVPYQKEAVSKQTKDLSKDPKKDIFRSCSLISSDDPTYFRKFILPDIIYDQY